MCIRDRWGCAYRVILWCWCMKLLSTNNRVLFTYLIYFTYLPLYTLYNAIYIWCLACAWQLLCTPCRLGVVINIHRVRWLPRWSQAAVKSYSERHACRDDVHPCNVPGWNAADSCNRWQANILLLLLLGPFHGAIAVPSVTRCRCRGHRCAGGTWQYR